MRNLKITALIVLLVLAGMVVAQNLDPVETKFLFTSIKMPQAALLVSCLLIGYSLGLLTTALWKVHTWRAAHRAAIAEKPAQPPASVSNPITK